MAVRKRNSGFTLVEIAVVTGIFAILMLAGTNIFFQVIQSANRASVASELRQNASLVMDTIVHGIRDAGCVSVPDATTLIIYSTGSGGGSCAPSTLVATFKFANKVVTKTTAAGTATLSSPKVNFTGSTFTTAGSGGPVTINFIVTANFGSTRADYVGSIRQTETVSLRQYNF